MIDQREQFRLLAKDFDWLFVEGSSVFYKYSWEDREKNEGGFGLFEAKSMFDAFSSIIELFRNFRDHDLLRVCVFYGHVSIYFEGILLSISRCKDQYVDV